MKRFFSSGKAVILLLGIIFTVSIILFNIFYINDFQYSHKEYSSDTAKTFKIYKVNINTASVSELSSIDEIGETLAEKIVDYRTDYGKYKSINELLNVEGISVSAFERIKPFVTV